MDRMCKCCSATPHTTLEILCCVARMPKAYRAARQDVILRQCDGRLDCHGVLVLKLILGLEVNDVAAKKTHKAILSHIGVES
jgi:hypothetical protein